MRLKNLDLFLVASITLLNIIWAQLPDQFVLAGIVWILPFIFICPGYILTRLFFSRRVLNGTHLLLLSIGLSLVVIIVTGFILNLFPIGLQRRSWVIALGLPILALCPLLVYLRRHEQTQGILPVRFPFPGRVGLLIGLLLLLAMQIATLTVLYAAVGVVKQHSPGFTQFWMLPVVQTGKSCAVRLGVRNVEGTALTYRVTMTVNATSVPPTVVTLGPNQQWSELVPITQVTSNAIAVEAQLSREDQPGKIYRTVKVTIPNPPESKEPSRRPCGAAPPPPGSSATPVGGYHDFLDAI
jgi:uncharacterized membrane protein